MSLNKSYGEMRILVCFNKNEMNLDLVPANKIQYQPADLVTGFEIYNFEKRTTFISCIIFLLKMWAGLLPSIFSAMLASFRGLGNTVRCIVSSGRNPN